MKRVLFCLMVLIGALLAGCNQGTPGGPGTTDVTNKKTEIIQADDTFNLSVSVLPTSIKQGERIETSIGIKRGKNFDEDVELKFSNIPTGLKLEPSSPTIKHGDSEVKLTLEASNDAAIGDFNVTVTGHPAKGSDASVDFKVSVAKK